MINRIYATGYRSKDIKNLKPLVESLKAILIDIRFTPESQVLVWRQIYLKTLLREKYLHIPNLGSREFRETGRFSIQNLKLGVETLLALNTNLLLFCACAEQENCHRRLIAAELRKRRVDITEIADWKNTAAIFEQ